MPDFYRIEEEIQKYIHPGIDVVLTNTPPYDRVYIPRTQITNTGATFHTQEVRLDNLYYEENREVYLRDEHNFDHLVERFCNYFAHRLHIHAAGPIPWFTGRPALYISPIDIETDYLRQRTKVSVRAGIIGLGNTTQIATTTFVNGLTTKTLQYNPPLTEETLIRDYSID